MEFTRLPLGTRFTHRDAEYVSLGVGEDDAGRPVLRVIEWSHFHEFLESGDRPELVRRIPLDDLAEDVS